MTEEKEYIVGGIVSGKSYNGWFGVIQVQKLFFRNRRFSDIDIYVNSRGGAVFHEL